MFTLKELYDIKELLNSLSDDLKYFKDEKCEDAPVAVFNCIKKEDVRISKLIVKIIKIIDETERENMYDELPFSG